MPTTINTRRAASLATPKMNISTLRLRKTAAHAYLLVLTYQATGTAVYAQASCQEVYTKFSAPSMYSEVERIRISVSSRGSHCPS